MLAESLIKSCIVEYCVRNAYEYLKFVRFIVRIRILSLGNLDMLSLSVRCVNKRHLN